ncbi:MAG: Stp1/IreP family PP2C-type Ser/Thr phosphatase [Tissierellaceae bacterium]|jgi:protein phosphatase|nr:Stp1/IreP family PP2C-type Ser/Thr phosphatase [Tissierellaceae bacterium]
MEVGVYTHKGRIRENNQDSYYLSTDNEIPLYVVADGMGGHKAGEVASAMAVEIVEDVFLKSQDLLKKKDANIPGLIKKTIEEANREIFHKSLSSEECNGMGTTITLAYFASERLYIGHIGDSRAYIIRNKEIRQLTEDHSLVAEMVKNGSISKEEAQTHPQKNIITRALGTSENIQIDIIIEELIDKDIILLCTDGLTNMITEKEIIEILLAGDNLQKCCEKLVGEANSRGGYDNITAIAVRAKRNEVMK